MSVTIDYYISLNSPWTYMGSALLAEIAKRNGATVNVKPAKFGPIFEKTGGLPLPKRSPERRAYRLMELKRWREVRDIPLVLQPKNSPSDDLAATLDYAALHRRIVAIVAEESYALLERLAQRLLDLCFEDRRVCEATVRIEKPGLLDGATPGVTCSQRR